MCSDRAQGDAGATAVMEGLAHALDDLLALDLDAVSPEAVRALVKDLEVQARRMDAARVEVMAAIERRGLYAADGHRGAKTMVRHLAGLSNEEAARRDRAMALCRDVPKVGAAYRAGALGTCQLRRLGRAYGNTKIRQQLADRVDHLLTQVGENSYRGFDLLVSRFEQLADEDGAARDADAEHEKRSASMVRNRHGGWALDGHFGSLQGAAIAEVFERYTRAELEADWEKARAQHGDDATEDHLPRTDAQRRADALWQLCQDAASAPPGSVAPEPVVNLIMDQETFERWVARFAGAQPEVPDPADPAFRCSTFDGAPVNAAEAASAAVIGSVRRVVVNSAGVVIDLGRRVRLFQGSSRLAVLLQSDTCVWPGCQVPSSRCQADHVEPFHAGGSRGSTSPGNGAPLCGRHNRLKNNGYTTWRDQAGRWHTHRPDGTEI